MTTVCTRNLSIEELNPDSMCWIGSAVDLARFLVRFDGASSKRDLISRSTYELMTTSSLRNHYAKGWGVSSTYAVHDGSLPGTGSYVLNRKDGISAVFLMNTRFNPKTMNLHNMMMKITNGVLTFSKVFVYL